MNDPVKDWVLPTGFTLIAYTAGHKGTLANSTDEGTAERNTAS